MNVFSACNLISQRINAGDSFVNVLPLMINVASMRYNIAWNAVIGSG